jgi:hypothetical protein
MAGSAACIKSILGGTKTPEETDKEFVKAAAQALMAVAAHRGVSEFRMQIEAAEDGQWKVTWPGYVSPAADGDGGNTEAA